MPFQYRVVSAEKGDAFLEQALNEAASHGFRFVAVVGAHTILEREVSVEHLKAEHLKDGNGVSMKVFKGDCPSCGKRYIISVPEGDLWKARINPEARLVTRVSPQCGHEIPIDILQ